MPVAAKPMPNPAPSKKAPATAAPTTTVRREGRTPAAAMVLTRCLEGTREGSRLPPADPT